MDAPETAQPGRRPVGGPAIELRTAGRADTPALDALLQRSYAALMAPAYAPNVLAPALAYIARANPELVAGGTYYLATFRIDREAPRLLGGGGWSFARPGEGAAAPGLAHIRHFAVDPAAVGQGVGAALFRHCRAAAHAAGAAQMEVYASLNAVGFYARMGFRDVGAVTIPLGPDVAFPARWMHQRL